MLRVSHLTMRFGHRTALSDVSADFAAGRVHFLMGPNGAGKTTLIRSILGLYHYDGTISWNGHSIDPSARELCPVFDDAAFYPRLTGEQNLRMLVPEARNPRHHYLSSSQLHRRVRTYSHGQRMRLALTMAFSCDAQLIILDEPTNGLDREAMEQLRTDVRTGTPQSTFLITGHNLEFFEDVVDTVHVLRDGHLVESGSHTDGGGPSLAQVYQQHFPTGS